MIEAIIQKYNKLKKREQAMVITFAVAISLLLVYRAIYSPLARAIKTYGFQIKKLETRLGEITTKFPDVEEEAAKLESLDTECASILDEITGIERKLPSIKNTSQLISELTRLSGEVKLSSVRQKVDVGEKYSRIFVETKFNSNFKDIVNYIKRLESISPFLAIDEVNISEPGKQSKEPGIPVRLVISSILGEIPFAEELKAQESKPTEVARDIFVSRARPAALVREADLKLQGITYNPSTPTAIINNEVVRIGSKVSDLIVKHIGLDTVVLTDGVQDQMLSIER